MTQQENLRPPDVVVTRERASDILPPTRIADFEKTLALFIFTWLLQFYVINAFYDAPECSFRLLLKKTANSIHVQAEKKDDSVYKSCSIFKPMLASVFRRNPGDKICTQYCSNEEPRFLLTSLLGRAFFMGIPNPLIKRFAFSSDTLFLYAKGSAFFWLLLCLVTK